MDLRTGLASPPPGPTWPGCWAGFAEGPGLTWEPNALQLLWTACGPPVDGQGEAENRELAWPPSDLLSAPDLGNPQYSSLNQPRGGGAGGSARGCLEWSQVPAGPCGSGRTHPPAPALQGALD